MTWPLEKAMAADVYEADLAELRDGCVPALRAEVERLRVNIEHLTRDHNGQVKAVRAELERLRLILHALASEGVLT